MTENWRAIPGFEGAYEVSDLGRVRSLDRVVASIGALRGYPKRLHGRLLKPQIHSQGYLQVALSGCLFLVSWLVLAAFMGPRPLGFESCHKDGNRKNNSLANLRWGDHTSNCADRITHGTHSRGERNGAAKLIEKDILEIRESRASRYALAKKFGVYAAHIDRIRNRTRWAHV